MEETKIRKVVLREDLLAITEDFREAIILNQFIYWSERVKDADKLIEQENEIARKNGAVEREPLYGWIYKSAKDMADETMLGIGEKQARRYMSSLVAKGFLCERYNPKYKWDRKMQYKINLVNIGLALREKGYPLSDYKIELPETLDITQPSPMTDEWSSMTDGTDTGVVAIADTTVETNKTKTTLEGCRAVSSNEGNRTTPFDYGCLYRQIKTVCMEKDRMDIYRSLVAIFDLFYKKYRRVFLKEHPKLRNKHISEVIELFIADYISGDIDEDISKHETYMDDYFYGNNHFVGNEKGRCNHSIIHYAHTLEYRYYNTERANGMYYTV